MSYTKREFVEGAYAEIGAASYVFDLSAEDLQLALRRLDSMMAEWNARGIRLGYPLPASPSDSDLDEITTVPDSANEAIITNLAVRLAPGIGKTPAIETKVAASHALDTLLARAAMPSPIQLPSMPYGAGSKQVDSTFTPAPDSPLQAGPDSEITFQ